MTTYSGKIETYQLKIETTNVHTKYKRIIYLTGEFGQAFIYFVPEGSYLGANNKINGKDLFHVYFWEHNWDSIVDILRNEAMSGFYFSSTESVKDNDAMIYTGTEPFAVDESV